MSSLATRSNSIPFFWRQHLSPMPNSQAGLTNSLIKRPLSCQSQDIFMISKGGSSPILSKLHHSAKSKLPSNMAIFISGRKDFSKTIPSSMSHFGEQKPFVKRKDWSYRISPSGKEPLECCLPFAEDPSKNSDMAATRKNSL